MPFFIQFYSTSILWHIACKPAKGALRLDINIMQYCKTELHAFYSVCSIRKVLFQKQKYTYYVEIHTLRRIKTRLRILSISKAAQKVFVMSLNCKELSFLLFCSNILYLVTQLICFLHTTFLKMTSEQGYNNNIILGSLWKWLTYA
jgi:hypothetical protein